VKETIHYEFFPPKQAVSEPFCVQVLDCLWQHINSKIPHHRLGKWILHHDNASSHAALLVKLFLAKIQITIVETSTIFA
jgi:hypothetical protein